MFIRLKKVSGHGVVAGIALMQPRRFFATHGLNICVHLVEKLFELIGSEGFYWRSDLFLSPFPRFPLFRSHCRKACLVFFILLLHLFAQFLFFLLLLLSVCFDPLIACVYLLFGFTTEYSFKELLIFRCPSCLLLVF